MSPRHLTVLLLGVAMTWLNGCGPEGSYSEHISPSAVPVNSQPTTNSGGQSIDSSLPMIQRQVILNAELTVVVDQIDQASREVSQLVEMHAGVVTHSSMDGYGNRVPDCQWTIRVTPDKYNDLLNAIAGLGEISHRLESSQDVTAEAVDLEARIRNKTQEESRLLKHLESSTGNLSEILLVEKEISRVREELERMQGQRNLLRDKVDMATITLRLTQIRPIKIAKSVGFIDQVSTVWNESWRALLQMLRYLCLAILAVLPWLITMFLPAFILWKFIERRRLRNRRGVVKPTTESPWIDPSSMTPDLPA